MPKPLQQNLLSCSLYLPDQPLKPRPTPSPQWIPMTYERQWRTISSKPTQQNAPQKIHPSMHSIPRSPSPPNIRHTACSTGSSVKRCAVCVAKDCTATSNGDAGGHRITLGGHPMTWVGCRWVGKQVYKTRGGMVRVDLLSNLKSWSNGLG